MKCFFTDHYFRIGNLHYRKGVPCQDYALSGTNGQTACAVVSDGCSTGRHTEMGAAIQSLSIVGAIKKTSPIPGSETFELIKAIQTEKRRIARSARLALGLAPADMLATALYAYLSQEGGVIQIEGDGAVLRKYEDGSFTIDRYQWDGNMPFYPSYRDADLECFISRHGSDREAERLTHTKTLFAGSLSREEVVRYTLAQGISGISIPISAEELKRVNLVALFTDGVEQIKEVSWERAIRELTSFKTLEGEFVKRRMIRGLSEFGEQGNEVLDDIAMAAIRIANETEEGEPHDGSENKLQG